MADKEKDKEKQTRKRKNNTAKKEKVEVEINNEKEKNKKYTFGLFEVILIMIVTTLFGLFVGSFVAYKKYNNKKVSCKEVREDTKDLVSAYDNIVNEYYGDFDKEKLIDFGISGMVDSLNDNYALFVDKDYANSLNEELDGSFVGLGVEVRNGEDGYIIVSGVMENSPAYRYGIELNDRIVSVDGINLIGEDISVLVDNVKYSPVGTKKKIEILRNDELLAFDVVLDVVDLKSVNGYFVERDGKRIGIITLTNFASNTYNQFVVAYNELKNENIDSLVIDVRNNGGGYLSSANLISSMFLNKGDIIYKKTNGKNIDDIVCETDKEIDIPVVLLVNGLTASSSEVFVSSLKENTDVLVVGTNTYGKGMIQKLFELSNGKYIKFSVQEWLTASGNKIEGVGIIPDVYILPDEQSEYDVQLEKAVEVAKEK